MILPIFLQIVRWVNTVLTVRVFSECLISHGEFKWKWNPDARQEMALFPHIISNSLTQWSSMLPEKLTVPQSVKKFTVFDGTRRLITLLTTTRLENHLFLISPWMQRLFVRFLPKYLKFATIKAFVTYLHAVTLSCIDFTNFNVYFVFATFTSRPTFLLAINRTGVFCVTVWMLAFSTLIST